MRNALLIKLAALICVLAVMVAGSIRFIVYMNGGGTGVLHFGKNEDSVVQGEKVSEKEVYNADDVTGLNLNAISADVSVRYGTDDKITVEYATTSKYDSATMSLNNGIVYVKQVKTKKSLISPSHAKMTITLPKNKELNSIVAQSVSGDINATISKVNNVNLSSTSGSITANGKMLKVNAESTSGDIDLSTISETMVLNTVSGSINATSADVTNSITANTVSGDVDFDMRYTPDYTINFSTVSGEYESSSGMDSKSGTFTVGKGTVSVNVDTTSGDLDVK